MLHVAVGKVLTAEVRALFAMVNALGVDIGVVPPLVAGAATGLVLTRRVPGTFFLIIQKENRQCFQSIKYTANFQLLLNPLKN